MGRNKTFAPPPHRDSPVPAMASLPTQQELFDSSESDCSDDSSDEALDDSEQEDIVALLIRQEERDKKKQKKGRQGRSHESRRRAEEVKKHYMQFKDDVISCKDCGCTDLVEDHQSGDLICSDCGLVHSGGGVLFDEHFCIRGKLSKRYQELVHFRQRLAQLRGWDPMIKSKIFNRLTIELRNNKADLTNMGKRRVSKALTNLKLPRRFSANWIQIRRRMGLNPVPDDTQGDAMLWTRMNFRYSCLATAFHKTLSRKTDDGDKKKDVPKALQRKNIINVNYSFIQLLRLEDEKYLEIYGRYFPQLCSKEQPQKNNRRWKILIEYLDQHYKKLGVPKLESVYCFNWEYKPLTQALIEKHCMFFD